MSSPQAGFESGQPEHTVGRKPIQDTKESITIIKASLVVVNKVRLAEMKMVMAVVVTVVLSY